MKRYKDLEIKIKKKLSGDFLGSFKSAFKGLGVEFDSLREYIPGDSIKSIDWKTTAKLGDVHVKNYEEEKDLKILFIIENSKSFDFGSEKITKKETLEEVFFMLAQSALSTGNSIGIQIGTQFIDFKKGEENIIKALDILSSQSPLSFLKGQNSQIKKIKDSLVFVLTDKLERENTDLKYLNIHNEIVFINIFDSFENTLSHDSFETNIHKLGALFFGNNTKVSQYQNLRKNKIKALKKTLKKQYIEYIKIDNHDNIFLKFYKFFNSYKI